MIYLIVSNDKRQGYCYGTDVLFMISGIKRIRLQRSLWKYQVVDQYRDIILNTIKCSCDLLKLRSISHSYGGRHGCDRMVVGLITTRAISAYHH